MIVLSIWRLSIWRLMAAVAAAACATGAFVSFCDKAGGLHILVGWVSLHGALAMLTFARGIPPSEALGRAFEVIQRGLPYAVGFGLISGAMGGEVGLIGGSAFAALITGLVALAAAAFMSHD
jgi:hypothetical protein